ncbi:MAG TPA: MBL fold metallo-hydrolase [Syntrophorhabdaceae bacterium]|nr:MBL fold metallo-hydrolase [Syntrophorhabdaceae bacterium]HPP06702.1 MBL fold metallo-hydrolase [Syntrophorhabdaceae bacterium]
MIFKRVGEVKDGFYVTGFPWSPVYLIDGEIPVIFEAGFHCMAKIYEKHIREVIDEKHLEYLFITHFHYDHCGAASYFKNTFSELKICASQRASEIIKRPNAQELMKTLSKNVYKIIYAMEGIDKNLLLDNDFEPFHVDIILKDLDTIEVCSDLTIEVFETPGHTRDMLSYYIPERKILIATEAAGCMGQTGHIVTEFLVDYDRYISSLKRLSMLDVEILCQGHHFVYTGEDVKRHFEQSMKSAERFKEEVIEYLKRERGDVDKVVEIIKAIEYDPNPGPKQPEKAYLLNLRTRVVHLAERFLENRSLNQ